MVDIGPCENKTRRTRTTQLYSNVATIHRTDLKLFWLANNRHARVKDMRSRLLQYAIWSDKSLINKPFNLLLILTLIMPVATRIQPTMYGANDCPMTSGGDVNYKMREANGPNAVYVAPSIGEDDV